MNYILNHLYFMLIFYKKKIQYVNNLILDK